MNIRTDLISESFEMNKKSIYGTETFSEKSDGIISEFTAILTDSAAHSFSRPKGKYYTLKFDRLDRITQTEELKDAIIKALCRLLPENRESIMVAGLGNSDITPDALGPLTVNKLIATRHIGKELKEKLGLEKLKDVSALAPGVLGKTGIETVEIISATVEKTKPSALIVIDALAARSPERLCSTVQLSDTGISPGSGVNNSRKEISFNTLGIPVIAIGIPTVIDSSTYDSSGKNKDDNMMVTPKEIDLLIEKASEVISSALNIFLQPEISEDIISCLSQ